MAAATKRKYLDAEVKADALQRHLVGKEPVSDLCRKLDVQPSVFYNWQRELFARAATVLGSKPGRQKVDRSAEIIAGLEAKLAKKDEVISELLEEHVALKKSLGRS